GGDVVRVDLQAVAADLFVVTQPRQQLAVAAAEVEHPAAGRNPVLDDVQIGAHLGSLYGYAVHVTAEGLQVAGIGDQEGIVALRRVDLQVADVLARGEQRIDDLPRALR